MLEINITKGKEILCLRFANVGGLDCIQEHIKILNKSGYVWFGKIGNKPSSKILNEMIENKSNYILLKEPKKACICQFEVYGDGVPDISEYPNYYNTEILPTRQFSIWFKLTSIIKVNSMSELDNIVVKSSRSPILETSRKSMNSQFYTITTKDINF